MDKEEKEALNSFENETSKKKKPKKNEEKSRGRKVGLIIWNIVFWSVLGGIFLLWLIEFILVKTENDPIFCIDKKTHEYSDGTVEECTGLGYKVYHYKRTAVNAYEFGPFFIKMKE